MSRTRIHTLAQKQRQERHAKGCRSGTYTRGEIPLRRYGTPLRGYWAGVKVKQRRTDRQKGREEARSEIEIDLLIAHP